MYVCIEAVNKINVMLIELITFAVINMYHLRTQKINVLPGINTLKTHDKITLSCNCLIKQMWLLLYQFFIALSYFSQPIKDQGVCFLSRLVLLSRNFFVLFFSTLTTFILWRNLPKIPWRDKLGFLSLKNFLQIQLFSGMVWHGCRKVLYPVF